MAKETGPPGNTKEMPKSPPAFGSKGSDGKVAKRAFQVFFGLFLMAAAFFIAAGRLDIPRAWLYYGMMVIYVVSNFFIFMRYSPDIIRERSEIKFGAKSWDKAFAIGYTLAVLAIQAVAGLDMGRFAWSELGFEFEVLGIVLFTIGASITCWAMVVNKFFETTVTIVKGHQVVSGGPYAYIRHPGYAGMILTYCSAPLVIGSAVSLIPAAILAILFIGRTYMEDKTLQEELDGYKEYTRKVKYKLVPFVW